MQSETKDDSYGAGFASAGGGVFATLFDDSQIAIWFWPRSSIPASISTATSSVDISDWGTPSANYTSTSCDIASSFAPQQLVLDITLCGDWAGVASIYSETCPISGGGSGNASSCYLQNVINDGNTTALSTAYFEINYIKAFNKNGTILSSGGSTSSVDASSVFASATSAASTSASATGSSGSSAGVAVGAMASGAAKAWAAAAGVGALIAWTLL